MKYGCHLDITDTNILLMKKSGFQCTQYMPGGELAYTPGNQFPKIELALSYGIVPVFHAPLVCYCVANKKAVVTRTLIYLKTLDYYVSAYNRKYNLHKQFCVVVHAGSLDDKSVEARENALREFCGRFLKDTQYLTLCIENDVGSKGGTKIGSVSFLYNFVSKFNNPRIKLCIDTNHAWGHEQEPFDVTSLEDWDSIIDEVRVIHFNCIPEISKRYEHKDRHSDDLLENSCYGATSWLLELFKRNYRAFYITERNSYELSARDYEWVLKNVN